MLTTTGHRLPGAPGRLVTETAVWGALIALAAISYVVAGANGLLATVSGRAFSTIADTLGDGEFDNRLGSLSLLIVFVFAGAGLFLPNAVFAGRGPAVRKLALSLAALVEAALLIVLSLAPSAWLTWVSALVLGAVIGLLLSLTPFTNEKPWRRVGVPATLLLFLSCSFQIMGGAEAGTMALGWMSLIVGIVMAVGAVMVYLTPERALHAESATTGAFPIAKARVARPPASIEKPWVPIALFGVLGAAFILSQPTAVEHSFGQAGYALMLVVLLLGWAIGFEMGPTFAPGMSRPRVSAFALVVSGVLLVAIGAIDELSGKVVLTGAVAFLVGIGVRSQVYDFSRRLGAVAGGLAALLLNAVNIAVAPLGTAPEWSLMPPDLAFVLIGLAALVAGIVGLCVFDPHGMQGLSVDIVHGFRPHNHSEEGSRDGVGALADRFGPGFFIAIEGGDGAGKSTQIERVSRALADDGYSVEATREPGGTELGRRIRSVLFDAEPPSPRTEALLFAADRAHHIASLVDPSLEAGSVVITDRYIDSTVAYQAAGREFDPATILALSRWATVGLIPHLTIVLDIDPEVAAGRMDARGESNYLDEESRQFHQRVRQTYLSRAQKDPERYVVLDASVSQDELTAEILEAVRARLPHTLKRGSTDAPAAAPPSASEESETIVFGAARTRGSAPRDDEAGDAVVTSADGGSAGIDAEEPRSRFIPVSEERVVPAAHRDTEDEGVATERVDLGADLRDDAEFKVDSDDLKDRPDGQVAAGNAVSSGQPPQRPDRTAVLPTIAESASAAGDPAAADGAADRAPSADGQRAGRASSTGDVAGAKATGTASAFGDAGTPPARDTGDGSSTGHGQKAGEGSSTDDGSSTGDGQEASDGSSADDREEAATTVLPSQRFTPQAPITDDDGPDEAPTTVIDTSAAVADSAQGGDRGSDDQTEIGDEAPTTVLPARSARQMSRERLQAQAEIERQARERVRRQRERNRDRFGGPEGSQ